MARVLDPIDEVEPPAQEEVVEPFPIHEQKGTKSSPNGSKPTSCLNEVLTE